MSLLPIDSNQRFVSNTSRARRRLRELHSIEESFARHLGKIEGARGPRITRAVSPSEWNAADSDSINLGRLKAGGTQAFGTIMFRSSYMLETNDTMVGVDLGDGKGFVRTGVGDGFTSEQNGERHRLRWRIREALVKAIRSIATDVAKIQSVDVLKLTCDGIENLRVPSIPKNNVLHLQHTIILDRAAYGDQAILVELLKQDASLAVFSNAVKFIAFDEITLMMQRTEWEHRTGKKLGEMSPILYRKDCPAMLKRELRLKRLMQMAGPPVASIGTGQVIS
ncbi:Uncharacterised protein [uncultured archaeon]|nr:Uncharacterised protein [uncultured archaeon]